MASKNDKIILQKIYPKIAKSLASNTNKFKKCVADYIQPRTKELYDVCPCDRIYFGIEDMNNFYKSLNIDPEDIKKDLSQTYYFNVAKFNPAAAKDEFTVSVMNVIRYFYVNNKKNEAELAGVYLAFSGKFYPSIHYGRFPTVPPSEHRHVMEYVVNNMLSNKFDIKREGSLFGAIRSIVSTWLKGYGAKFKSFDDEDVAYLIQQLHNRIKSFLTNIAEIYYKVYDDKDYYLSYDSDRTESNDDGTMVKLADNDSLKAERAIAKTMTYLNNHSVDMKICKTASDSNVKMTEVYSIIESILSDNDNIVVVKEFVSCIIYDYMANSDTKDIRGIDFISYSITPKPNSKNPIIIREKEILEGWLDEKSDNYRRRKSREATKVSYHKSILTYFVLTINAANK